MSKVIRFAFECGGIPDISWQFCHLWWILQALTSFGIHRYIPSATLGLSNTQNVAVNMKVLLEHAILYILKYYIY